MGTRKTREELDAQMTGASESPDEHDVPALPHTNGPEGYLADATTTSQPTNEAQPVPQENAGEFIATAEASEDLAPSSDPLEAGLPQNTSAPDEAAVAATTPPALAQQQQPADPELESSDTVTVESSQTQQSVESDLVTPQADPADADEAIAGREADPRVMARLKTAVESLLFASGEPIMLNQMLGVIREIQADLSSRGLRNVIEALKTELRDQGRGIRIIEVSSGFQLRTPSEMAPFVRRLISRRPPRMTKPTLETLAIAAYRQPVTRGEIEDIRGVDTGAVLKHLLEKKLIKIIGRKDEPGKPLLYGTTREFLQLFSIKDLKSLPTLRDFVELSDEHRATLGLSPSADAQEQQPTESDLPGADFLKPDESLAYAPVGNDEVIQELSEVLDELRERDRNLRKTVFLPKEQEEAAATKTEETPAAESSLTEQPPVVEPAAPPASEQNLENAPPSTNAPERNSSDPEKTPDEGVPTT